MDREKKSQGSNTYIRQNEFQNKGHKKRQRGSLIIIKGRIHWQAINIVNIYAFNIRVPKYMRKILEDFKEDMDSNTLIIRDFNTPLSIMDRSSKQRINKDIVALNDMPDQMDLTDIYRTCHLKEAKYTFFSNEHGTFLKIEHIIGHKTSLNKFKKIEIISSTFSDHNDLKLQTNLKEKLQK